MYPNTVGIVGRWIIAVVILLLLYLILIIRRAFATDLRQVPGPFFAKFSNLYAMKHAMQCDMHELFPALHERYGPLVRYGPNKVSVADPSAIPLVYGINTKFMKSTFYRSFLTPHGGKLLENIFSTADPVWHKKIKSAIAPSYTLSNVRKLERLVDECTVQFLEGMREHAGTTVDFGTWVQWYAFDVIGNLTFAQTFNFMRNKGDNKKILESLEAANVYNTVIGQTPSLHPWLLGNSSLMNILMKVFPSVADSNPIPLINNMIDDALHTFDTAENKEEQGTQVEYLRKLHANSPERLADWELRATLIANLFAGSDTTAMGLRAIFYLLVKNPINYSKLRNEVDAAWKADKLSPIVEFQQAAALPYLQAVIKESLRVHPGVCYPLERVVPSGGAQICGQMLPEGTVVGLNAWVIHRDQIFGPDADRFRPERWLDADEEHLKAMDRALIPFGAGSRLCIGKHISMLEMTKFVPTVLLRYDVEWASHKSVWTVTGYWFAKQSDVLMRLISRNK